MGPVLGLLFMGFIGLGVLGLFIFWIWMLVDCATNEPSEGNDKIIWILIIIFTHPVGALIYLLVRRPQRISQFGK
ncbi:MAG: PLDc N-terminal domain-containing protein [Planctomycetota bacterium]|nr:PLDc N-terminal domain-containing protein [Planctomycetota bacterium]